MSENLHKFFYRDYFEDDFKSEDKEGIKSLNGKLTSPLKPEEMGKEIEPLGITHIKLKVCYPGLITGVGVSHEMGLKGEIKLGINFDYTKGTPVISGSTVKGVLRSYFPQVYDLAEPDVDTVIREIFEGKRLDGGSKHIYDRDIFFDAPVVKANSKGCIFFFFSLAPHPQDLFKEPVPITFAKIAPGCIVDFRFRLTGKDKERKMKWFKEILTTYGVGAKTNVGYGRLSEK